FELLLCHGTVCVVGKMRDLILQLSKSSIYSTKPRQGFRRSHSHCDLRFIRLSVRVLRSGVIGASSSSINALNWL
ncbi:hypothetical protein DD571_22840, partial [Klebsiella pneumoniae]